MRGRMVLGFVLILAAGQPVHAQEARGNRAFRRGDVEESVERYRKALEGNEDEIRARVRYNLGSALLRLGGNDAAMEELRRALEGQDPELRTRAFYNLGNALVGQANPDEETLRQAVEAYRRTLLLDPDHANAKWNLEMARQRLERMQQQGRSSQRPRSQRPPQEEDDDQSDGPGRAPPAGSGAEPGTEGQPQPQLPGDMNEPLPRELAEQILRAVEEAERELQREKMRRSPTQRSGPDW